tara:strand:- start:484 stop:1512 length:1029 start_codon:yes stop_codon:yes gene_type:complete
MAVDTGKVNNILADVNERIKGTIESAGLSDAMGTTVLDPVQKLVNEFTTMATDVFSRPETTEGMLMAEADDVVNQAALIIAQIANKRQSQLSGMVSGLGSITPADSPVWNDIISNAGSEVDRIARVYGQQVANMPKALRDRLDADMAQVLDSINVAFNKDPSPNNAASIRTQVTNTLMKVEKDLKMAVDASLSASIQNIASQKMTRLQELEMALVTSERGMEKAQRGMWRGIAAETKGLIQALTKSNYLVYDKVIRTQKLAVIDKKLALLENLRVNSTLKMNTLDGYFGGGGHRRHNKVYSSGSSLGTGYKQMTATPKSAFKQKPPGFAGYAGRRGGGPDFF